MGVVQPFRGSCHWYVGGGSVSSRRKVLKLVREAPRRLRGEVVHRLRWGRRAPGINEVINVDPRQVRGYFWAELAARLRKATGVRSGIIGGDWDVEVPILTVEDTDVFRSCVLRWQHGRRWQDTPMYLDYLRRIEQRKIERFASERELLDRYQQLDDIFHWAREHGRLSDAPSHLLRINVGRDGRLIYGPDGRHRLAIALLAEVEVVPASVRFVHVDAIDHFLALRG
jgi:hypothetical protein